MPSAEMYDNLVNTWTEIGYCVMAKKCDDRTVLDLHIESSQRMVSNGILRRTTAITIGYMVFQLPL